MFLRARLALALVRAKLAGIRARGRSAAPSARRAITDGITWGAGLAAAILAALCALVCVTTGCPAPTPANGAISVTWSVRAANDVAVSCGRVGARFVALRLRNRATAAVTATAFPCPNSPGTAQIAPGLYDIAFQLDGADGVRLATAPDQIGVSIVSGRLTQLAPVTFRLTASPPSTLVLSLASEATTNCGPTSAGGAGITGDTITVVRPDGGCVPVTFTRQRGSEQRGTYVVNCSSPQIAPCIEKDETLTAQLDPSSYVVTARGKVGVVDCFVLSDRIDVPASSIVERTLILPRTNNSGCP